MICLPWGRPCGNHAKRCMNEKTIQCLPNPTQHVPIYLEQFPSYPNRNCKKSQFSRTAAHIFVSLETRPCDYHAKCCMDGKTIQSLSKTRSMCPSIFNSFPVIRTASAKNRSFRVPQPTFFVSPGDAPAIITQYVAWIERQQFNACQTPRSMYLSIFNSFRVIRCLSQCVSPTIAIFTTFLFSLGTPLGKSR